MDAKVPPAPVSQDIASHLPSLENTKVALFRTWGDVLNKQSKVTGAHCWVPSTLGSVLFVTVFDSYAETVLKVCITGYYYITRKWVSRCLLGLGLGSRRGSLRLSGLGSRRGSLGIGGLSSSWLGLGSTLLRLGILLLLGLCRQSATFLEVAAARSHFSG